MQISLQMTLPELHFCLFCQLIIFHSVRLLLQLLPFFALLVIYCSYLLIYMCHYVLIYVFCLIYMFQSYLMNDIDLKFIFQ